MPLGQKHLKTEDTEEDEEFEEEERTNIRTFTIDDHSKSSGAPLARVTTTTSKKDDDPNRKRRKVVSSACLSCRKRKSKCDGNLPACAACASVYGTECIYDPNSDHRRKGVYKRDIDNLKTRNSTLQTLIQAILNYPEEKVPQLIHDIRNCESLDDVAAGILSRADENSDVEDESGSDAQLRWEDAIHAASPSLESDITDKIGALRMDDHGQVKFIGATSSLSLLPMGMASRAMGGDLSAAVLDPIRTDEDPMVSWTEVTKDRELVIHLINMYFTWHYPYFTTLSKSLFFRDFLRGNLGQTGPENKVTHCTPLLVNAMLALGCHFTLVPGSRKDPSKPSTAGDHFFQEAKRLIMENDEHEQPRLPTTQALALMSVREAGCGREARGWVYSGMSFRMACDLGLQWSPDGLSGMSDNEIDARKITFWGCFLFDKCWSNYTGRLPQLPTASTTTPKYDVFPDEDSEMWTPYTDNGLTPELSQPGRTRAVALHLIGLCEISNDILLGFYQPVKGGTTKESKLGKGRAQKDAEMKKLLELYNRLEDWAKKLPAEMAAKEGTLPNVLLMHMFCQLLYLLLFRPFLKVNPGSASFPANLSPKRICINASTTISKLLRLYKRTYGLKQICNIAVYIALSACTIHLMNLPTKAAKRDVIQGVKCLEEIAEYWLCAKRALIIVKVLSQKYSLELPEEAEVVLSRIDTNGEMFGFTVKDLVGRSPRTASAAAMGKSSNGSTTTTTARRDERLAEQQGLLGQAVPITPMATVTPPQQPQMSPTMTPVPPLQNGDYGSLVRPGSSILSTPPQPFVATSATQLSSIPTSTLFTPYFDPGASPSSNSHGRGSLEPSGGASSPQILNNANSPSMYAGYGQLEDQSQDWWLRDQAELAQDLGNWEFSPGTVSPEPFEAQYSGQAAGSVQAFIQQVTTQPPQAPGYPSGNGFEHQMYWQ